MPLPPPPPWKIMVGSKFGEVRVGGAGELIKVFKGKYEAHMKFPEGGGGFDNLFVENWGNLMSCF